MTAASAAASAVGSPLPKWQLALAVGAPVALGVGYIYYRNTTKPATKPSRGKSKPSTSENGTPASKQISIDGDENPKSKPTASPENESPLDKAQRFKNEGNSFFKAGKFDEAILHYNKAIETCPTENTNDLATFYQNRAAAYEQLKKFSAVKTDCTKALELNPLYVKALQRRARAMEHSNELEAVLEDITAVCILERFTNQKSLQMADRVLKQLGKQHAEEHMATKKPIMPSSHFIKTYLSTFHREPICPIIDESSDSEKLALINIQDALKDERYDDIIPLCTEVIDREENIDCSYKMKVLLTRATFYNLLGQYDNAIQDLNTVISSQTASNEVKVNALIKRACIHMQLENIEACFTDFDAAVKIDADCGDIYHHRGQISLLMDNIDEAKKDFQRAVDFNPNFGVAYGQKCYADYQYAVLKRDVEGIETAIKNFENALEKFPNCCECYTLYAQVLCDTQEFAKADDCLVKAFTLDPKNATVLVHRGLLYLRWNHIEKATGYIRKALELDDKCEFGYETLGTIEVQRGNLKEAIELFDKALKLSRTTVELGHIYSLKDAAKSQLSVSERLGPDVVWNLQRMSQTL
ncbi:mitochondrial import receptor subunit TOM70 [Orussus abietinus]|uniref:mitochondrial import receptor subunit TOM70 n=1 Tax=Orussus abietinus TaxID=222816 RepID=UPI00062659BE|nr:mitochondrial import receptor subunit TOM70 [Orussus abietinus]